MIDNTIKDNEHYRCMLIMNSDSTATLNFFQILDYKSLNLMSIILKLGDADEVNKHVSYRYRLVSHQLKESKAKLEEVCNILKLKNPSLISQINKAAMISQPYHLRMQTGGGMHGGAYAMSQNSGRSIKSKAMSSVSKATFK